jgi:hypothetical protein
MISQLYLEARLYHSSRKTSTSKAKYYWIYQFYSFFITSSLIYCFFGNNSFLYFLYILKLLQEETYSVYQPKNSFLPLERGGRERKVFFTVYVSSSKFEYVKLEKYNSCLTSKKSGSHQKVLRKLLYNEKNVRKNL